MDIDDEKISLAAEFTKQCLLPELDREIGNEQLERADFNLYVYGLEQNLRLLFGIISKNGDILFKKISETEPFRVHLVLLLNEQSGSRTAPFQTIDRTLLAYANSLILQYYSDLLSDKKIYCAVLDHYKTKLKIDLWKKNIGAVYGYERFCELSYGKHKSKLTANDGLFMMSAGTILTEYFEEIYKSIGINLYRILIEHGDKKFLHDSNMYQAIYSKIMDPLIITIQNEETTITLLNCLYVCVRNDKSWLTPSNWNKIDDVLEELLKRIALENSNKLSLFMFIIVAKCIALPIMDNEIVRLALDFDRIESNSIADNCNDIAIDRLREVCCGFENHLAYRWTKKLLLLFAQQTFFGKTEDIVVALKVANISYIICIFPISIKLLDQHWIDFIEKLLPTLIEVHKSHKTDTTIKKEVVEFINTCSKHIRRDETNLSDHEETLNEIKASLQELSEEIIN